MELLKELDPIKAQQLENPRYKKPTPSNVEQFTDETFKAKMQVLDQKYIMVEGVDLGQKMKVMAGQFDKKLQDISEYVFETVGKEVEKAIAERGDQITKMISDARTIKVLKDRPSMMKEYLE
jgi:hypothetical protein